MPKYFFLNNPELALLHCLKHVTLYDSILEWTTEKKNLCDLEPKRSKKILDLNLPWTQILKVIFSQEHFGACEFKSQYSCWVWYVEYEQEIIAEFHSLILIKKRKVEERHQIV